MSLLIGTGRGQGDRSARAPVRVLDGRRDYPSLVPGEIAVLKRPDSELVIWLDRLSGIITRSGGIGAHLALIALEGGIPYLVLQEEFGNGLRTGVEVVMDPVKGTVHLVESV
ncbi:PEP-utilizing enzyme [Streptomyces griseoluteus]|uniref:PEP-utilizing enzyme n=1 Tax=Streptomyces griseoluteus TaxID=29306 RepID=UPI00343EA48F